MSDLFRFDKAVQRDPHVDAWFAVPEVELRHFVQPWFELMRACGTDVRELLHDGHPTACASDAAFGYVDAFSSHVCIGFYQGAALNDPSKLLEGSGKRMRHVKIRRDQEIDAAALQRLIMTAYQDMCLRLESLQTNAMLAKKRP